jgi:hypothetical protein
MSNGERWQDWINKNVIACPLELPFETKIKIDGEIYTCKDRGSAIVYDGNAYWVDVLTDNPKYRYGEIISARIIGE